MAYGTAERKNTFLQFFEGMMTLFYLVGKCALGWCSFCIFNYFSQCYDVVKV